MLVSAAVSCGKEDPLTPTPMYDDLLFEFPQDNKEYDRDIQKIQEKFGTYVIYKDITGNLLNRAWINLYPTMSFVAGPVKEEHVSYYVDWLNSNFFRYFDSEVFLRFFPKYFFLVDGLHREEAGVAKSHTVSMTEGVDFWAFSLQTNSAGVIQSFEEKLARIRFAYALIKSAFAQGYIEVPASFYQGIDYKNPIYGGVDSAGNLVHEWHYQNRGFVKYVQPSFEYESPSTNISIITASEDFLMFVRKILFTSEKDFLAENGRWDLVMRRYNIVLDLFKQLGVDLTAVSEGREL